MIPLIIEGRKVNLPTSWDEVTYAQYVELALMQNDLVGQVAYLIGMDRETLNSATFSDGLDHVFKNTKFLTKFEIEEYPDKLGRFTPGRDIKTMWQLNEMTKVVETINTEDLRGILQSIPRIAAIQVLEQPFDSEKAVYLAGELMKLPCTEVYSTGNYFFAKAMSLVYRKPIDTFRKHIPIRKKSFIKRLLSKWQSR